MERRLFCATGVQSPLNRKYIAVNWDSHGHGACTWPVLQLRA